MKTMPFFPMVLTLSLGSLPEARADKAKHFAVPDAVVIEGDAHARGVAYGKWFREGIRAFLAEEIAAPFFGKPSSKNELMNYAAACGEVTRRECPMVAVEFAGIAEGAGLSFNEIMLINLHEELYHRAELPEDAPKHGHCTAVAVSPKDSGDGKTYVGQTWDWMPSVAGKSAITEWRRPEGVSVLAYGFPGMPMGAGLNEKGIAHTWTSAALGQKGQQARVGLPSYVLIAHLLAQPDMDAVIREAKKNRHAGWFTFVMADAHGALVNIEGSPEKVAVERADRRLSRVGYGIAEMTGVAPGQLAPRHERCGRMLDLLAATEGRNDLARLQHCFSKPECRISVGQATIDLMVFDTTARAAHLSRGETYGLGWRTFSFGK